MAAIPVLKKKLKSVQATGKLSKAMKTVSAAKFSHLSTLWKNYSDYAGQFRFLYHEPDPDDVETTSETVVLMGSNRGFCGGFNNDVLNYYRALLQTEAAPAHLLVCGSELARVLNDEGIPYERAFAFGDVPAFAECEGLIAYLLALAGERRNYRVRMIYPAYNNPMVQTPGSEWLTLNPDLGTGEADDDLWLPERESVRADIFAAGARSILFGAVLATALGAQASTLLTMRSAYDTATEYSESLEGEIHRLRQSKVTADVIETSSERGSKGDESHG